MGGDINRESLKPTTTEKKVVTNRPENTTKLPGVETPVVDNTSKELSDLREDIKEEIAEEKPLTSVILPADNSTVEAINKLENFDVSRNKYVSFKNDRGIVVAQEKMTKTQAWVEAIRVNLKRLRGDIQRRKEIRRQIRSGEMRFEDVSLKIEVMERDALIEDSRMQKLWEIEGNRETLISFTEKELYQEVNATHWLMLSGASVEQFHGIIDGMGHNPDAFLSGDRGENGGRIVIDNYKEDMPIDEHDSRYGMEKGYWEALFRSKLLPEGMKKWHMSRNHSVIYSVKDSEGLDIIMLPVHIDPKNWVVSIKELFSPPKKGERSALAYHSLAEGEKRYLGTGLYELGSFQLINLLRKKQPGLFGALEVIGEDKLDTTRTISGDEERSVALEKVFRDKIKVK